jgi:uncharacterized protein YbjT (DUF2867 family)
MAENNIIAVFGATGAQGGGLVRAILDDPGGGFTARALTRDPTSEKAAALAEMGAEVVRADIDDAASVERALDGAYGAYCVTFFWEHFSPEHEKAEARRMAEAAKAVGLRHVISSADYRALGFPGAEDLGNMFQFKRDFDADFRAARDPDVARALNPRLQDFAAWLEANKQRITIA